MNRRFFWNFVFLAILGSVRCVACLGFQSDDEPEAKPEVPVLKEVFQDYFEIGTAVNRSVTTGVGFRRSEEQVKQDIEMVKRHFNHVVAENDMKWQLIHPRPGQDGYDFQAADALVEFAAKNGMSLAGHTLVWHSQTPNWVFEGTHLPSSDESSRPAGESSNSASAAASESARPAAVIDSNVSNPSGESTQTPDTSAGQTAAQTDRSQGVRPGGQGVSGQPTGGQRPGGQGPGGFGPPGFGRFRGFDLNGPRASREELLERMRNHIHTVVGRYKGKVKVWDVVNEAIADNGDEVLRRSPWSVIIGPDFIAKAFEYAHEADPDAILRYNDYGLENPNKRAKLSRLIKELQEQKVPVMAIGSQAHCNVTMTFEQMDATLSELKSLGLPIHITELDVNAATGGQFGFGADVAANAATTQGGLVEEVDAKLANSYAGIFQAFIKHKDAIDIVTFWGVNDAVSWRARGTPLLFDGNNQPKSAFHAVVRLVEGIEDGSSLGP